MEYELKHYSQVKYALVLVRQSFLKNPPKVISRAYFIILNKIDKLACQAESVRIFAKGEIPGKVLDRRGRRSLQVFASKFCIPPQSVL